MNNTVKAETVATDTSIFSDELKAKIIDTENYMEAHPDEWITSEEFFASLSEIN